MIAVERRRPSQQVAEFLGGEGATLGAAKTRLGVHRPLRRFRPRANSRPNPVPVGQPFAGRYRTFDSRD